MAIIPWRAGRQLFYFSIFALAILALIGGLVWYFWPKATCTDNRQNGQEEGVDCGGSCAPCTGEIKDLSVSWVRFFKNRENFYDAAALINNPNIYAGIANIKYTFKLYDANNILITVRDGYTFINPLERQVIFESSLSAGPRVPKYAYLEFGEEKNWKYIKKEKAFLSLVQKSFTNFPFPRLSAEIRNDSLVGIKNVLVSSVLYDEEGNAVGVSSTKIDLIPAESSQTANFTWPVAFDKEPANIEILPTTNLMTNSQE